MTYFRFAKLAYRVIDERQLRFARLSYPDGAQKYCRLAAARYTCVDRPVGYPQLEVNGRGIGRH